MYHGYSEHTIACHIQVKKQTTKLRSSSVLGNCLYLALISVSSNIFFFFSRKFQRTVPILRILIIFTARICSNGFLARNITGTVGGSREQSNPEEEREEKRTEEKTREVKTRRKKAKEECYWDKRRNTKMMTSS